MNINNAFPSKYLKSGDVTGDDMILTISHIEMENVGQGTDAELKPIVYFEETDKGLVLNKTNGVTISKMYSPETDAWPGKQIAIFATEVDFAGKQTLALRVRMRSPNGNGKAPKQAEEVKFQPVPSYTGAAETIRTIAVKLAEVVVNLKPAESAAASAGLIDAFKAAKFQATQRNLTDAIGHNTAKPSHTNAQVYTMAINLLNACAAKDEPEF